MQVKDAGKSGLPHCPQGAHRAPPTRTSHDACTQQHYPLALPAAGQALSTSDHDTGLASEEAARRLAACGPNTVPDGERRRWTDIVREAAREPMFLLLLAAAALYLLFGDLREGLFLCAMVGATVGLTLYQEGKAERALDALRDMSNPRALVIRDGQRADIDSSQLVPGDLIVLQEGDRIPADALVTRASGLQVDESLLTGEALPVAKMAAGEAAQDRIFAGTLVVGGHALACVTATGIRSQFGQIGASLRQTAPLASPLQRQATRLANRFALAGLVLSVAFVLLYGATSGDWRHALLAGIALAMSMLPEEFPVVLTIFPALGAWRLARQQVLTRRLPAIETLGAVSVLCVDKTGTLTENRMAVAALQVDGHAWESDQGATAPPAPFHELMEYAILASAAHPFDPMDMAFHRLGSDAQGQWAEHAHWTLLHEYGISPALRAVTMAWQAAPGQPAVVASKGAPEAIAALCRMDGAQRDATLAAADAMARRGLRVLGVARATASGDDLPAAAGGFDFRFLGLAGLADPLRADIRGAIDECRLAGIRVLMVTGDYPATASCIAAQAGLGPGAPLTGDAVPALSDDELRARLRATSVCARIAPDQKLRIVQALQADGAIVAMTGDGVNDAPALHAANVGIAMGQRGTDVARAAAALVLLDDSFASIVQAIRAGRRIFANVQKSMGFIIAVHAPIAGSALLPVLFGWPPLLYPMHIVFLELIIDPACALVFENEAAEPDLMRRPPRDPGAPLFNARTIALAAANGVVVLLTVIAGYGWALSAMPENAARAFGFATMVTANLVLIFASRSRTAGALGLLRVPNPVLWIVAGASLCLLGLAVYQPWLAAVFRFGPLSPPQLGGAALLGLSALLWLELIKRLARGRQQPGWRP